MLNEELREKLAEWVGINLVGVPKGCEPHFTESLDACGSLIQKLGGLEGFRLLSYQYIGFARDIDLLRHGWGIQFEDGVSFYASERESALALCLAIEKLIDGGK